MHFLSDIDLPAVIGVLTGFGLVVILPIVALLLQHQRKMAEIMRGKDNLQTLEAQRRLDSMEREIVLMRQQMAENILAFDDQRSRALSPPPAPEEASRLTQTL